MSVDPLPVNILPSPLNSTMPLNAAISPSEKPLIRLVEAKDADEHAANLSQWDQRYDQLSGGQFSGAVTELWLPQSQIFVETANQSLRQSCAAWDNSLWFGIPAPRSGLMSWGGQALSSNAVCIRKGGAEFELLTAPNFNLFGIVVQRDAFAEYLDSVLHRSLDDLLKVRDVVTLPISMKVGISRNLARILADADASLPNAVASSSLALQERIFATVAQMLCVATDAPMPPARKALRQPALDQLRETIQAQPDEHLSIDELCNRFHLSRRALQNYFEETTGLAPLAYMRALRLNGARRSLKHPDNHETVSEVAYAWGFNHLSKFAQQYQKLFGELPSQSLSTSHSH